ncbi:MAG: outer membrane beta-barrel protein [Ferruginibacter sp.]
MEDNFYNNDFERFLKDTTDNFRMYPSKKVWHSLYNDLHPARRWPSLAISLLLIASVLFVGITNNTSILNKQLSNEKRLAEAKFINDADAEQVLSSPATSTGNENKLQNNTALIKQQSPITTMISGSPSDAVHNNFEERNINNISLISDHTTPFTEQSKAVSSESKTATLLAETKLKNDEKIIAPASVDADINKNNSEKITVINNNVPTIESIIPENVTAEVSSELTNKQKADAAENIKKANTAILSDREWYEDYAFHNKAITSKFKQDASFQFYITPSIGFRKLSQNNSLNANNNALNNSIIVTNPALPQELSDKITQSSAINIETGTALLYNISKKTRLKTGIQFNYTSYNVNAIELSHPIQTNLLLNDPKTGAAYLSPRVSSLANSLIDKNSTKLKNNTLQIAIPVGADYKIAGKNNLKWYVGVDVQPTYITGGHLYALSADSKNYVEDPTLLRKWNMNAAIESFLSYKTPSGIVITVGPQARYQFLSTYDKRYTYTEKLYNFGLKFGMLTRF